MKKSLFLIICSLAVVDCFSQQFKRIELISSVSLSGYGLNGLVRVIKPVFSHEGSTLAADSADFNQQLNTADAFGHVVITQSDGTTVYSDLLNYNGNSRIAVLTKNVRLKDKDAVLTTDYLTYNMASKTGTYTDGGKITNGKDVLTSKNGYYFTNTRDAYFRYNVVVNTDDALIKSDTLRYNTGSKTAYFYGPTHIYGKDDTLYTENGTYNTESDQAHFGKNNLYSQGSKSLKGDSLFYDRKVGYGRAIGNIIFRDTEDNSTLQGGLGVYKKSDESILVTQHPFAILATKDSVKIDSIWITADTLYSKMILTKELKPSKTEATKAVAVISLQDPVKSAAQDTSKIRIVKFYNDVKIFKSDLQARSDSVFYSYADSIIRCYGNPMVWTQGSQLSADTILMQLKNKKLDNMLLQHKGFIVNVETDSSKYNQIKGKTLIGLFRDNKLSKLLVNGNAESIYYIMEDSAYTRMNRSVSSRIEFILADNKLINAKFFQNIGMRNFSIDKIPEDTEVLEGFIWKPKDRPRSKEEIIPSLITQPRQEVIQPKKPTVKPSVIPKK